MNLEIQKGSRSRVLAVILIGLMIAVVVRLFYLQIIRHDYYVSRASAEQVKRLTIPAKRGMIYALDNKEPVPLVMNQTVYTVFADPAIITDDTKILEVIRRVAGGNTLSGIDKAIKNKSSRYQVLAVNLTRTQADKIKKERLRGIGFQERVKRVYPEGQLAAQTLGYVDYNGIGQYGVEGKLNERLTGINGLLQSVTDVSNVPLTIGKDNIDIPAKDGDNLVLSIDRNVQAYVEQALANGLKRTGATRGDVIVMNPQNGRIVAMANLPTYSPAKYNEVTDYAVFNNGVVSTPYEPGSDVKTFTVAAGIDKGVVSPNDTYNNLDYITVDDTTIQNAYKGMTGQITFQTALNWSLNTGFVTIAERLGDGKNITRKARETMYDYFYNRFKLGQLTGVELSNEARGIIVSPSDPDGNAVKYSNMSFGQGLDVTMIQVATAFCSLVNGGKYYQPTVIQGVLSTNGKINEDKIPSPKTVIAKTTADTVRQMTHTARELSLGAADKPGYYTGGKTGTSQVIKNGSYALDETIATYLGYGGSEEMTNYVIMVRLGGDHKLLAGAADAGPVFTDISNWMLNYLGIKPKE